MERYEGETRCKELLQEIERLKEARDAERAKHRAALGKAQQRLFEARKDEAKAREDKAAALAADRARIAQAIRDRMVKEGESGAFRRPIDIHFLLNDLLRVVEGG